MSYIAADTNPGMQNLMSTMAKNYIHSKYGRLQNLDEAEPMQNLMSTMAKNYIHSKYGRLQNLDEAEPMQNLMSTMAKNYIHSKYGRLQNLNEAHLWNLWGQDGRPQPQMGLQNLQGQNVVLLIWEDAGMRLHEG